MAHCPDLLGDEERYRINVFDWEAEFPEVFAAGGFDAVIGNPPYIRIQTMKEWAPLEVEFYKTAFAAAGRGTTTSTWLLRRKGLGLLNAEGRLGFILSPQVLQRPVRRAPARTFLAKGKHLAEVVHFGDAQVFAGATTYTCLLFLERKVRHDTCRVHEGGRSGGLAEDRRKGPKAPIPASEHHRRRVELHRRPRRRPLRKDSAGCR